MLASDIIQQLNEYRLWPSLTAWFPIDVRLSVYRDERKWAMVMEALTFNQQQIGHESCVTDLYCFGDDFPPSAGSNYSELHVTKDGPSGPLFDPSEFMQHNVSLAATDMTIRGKVVPITTDPAEYAAAGIKLKQPPQIWGYELLRLVVPRHRRLFFATEAEIIERIGEPMPLLLRLDEWRHPEGGGEEMLGQSQTFQQIAEATHRFMTPPCRSIRTGGTGRLWGSSDRTGMAASAFATQGRVDRLISGLGAFFRGNTGKT